MHLGNKMPTIELKHKIFYPVSKLESLLEDSLTRYDIKLAYPERIWYTKPSRIFSLCRKIQIGKAAIFYYKSFEDELILKEILFGPWSHKREIQEILEKYIREDEIIFQLGESEFTLKSSKIGLEFETWSIAGLKLFFKALSDYCQTTIKEEQIFER